MAGASRQGRGEGCQEAIVTLFLQYRKPGEIHIASATGCRGAKGCQGKEGPKRVGGRLADMQHG